MIAIPEIVSQRARQLGEPGERWLRDLPDILAELAERWAFTAAAPLDAWSGALLLAGETASGERAVLKILPPDAPDAPDAPDVSDAAERALASTPTDPIGVLQRARGQGYARLLANDSARRALLLESLGPPLSALGWPVERQIEALCQTLLTAWRVPRASGPASWAIAPERRKARTLADYIGPAYQRLGAPCDARTVERALRYAERRASAFDLDRAVTVHGDPHPGNLLQALTTRSGAESGFVFVDPDGFIEDPTYDLGVVLRGWCDEIARGDALMVAATICALLAAHTGRDQTAIWEWGFIERVSTGLYILEKGYHDMAMPYLATADLLAASLA